MLKMEGERSKCLLQRSRSLRSECHNVVAGEVDLTTTELQRSRSLRSECHAQFRRRHRCTRHASTKSLPSERVSRCMERRFNATDEASTKSLPSERVSRCRSSGRRRHDALQRSRSLRSECHSRRTTKTPICGCFNEVAPFGASVTAAERDGNQPLQKASTKSLPSERVSRVVLLLAVLAMRLQRSRSLRSECHASIPRAGVL